MRLPQHPCPRTSAFEVFSDDCPIYLPRDTAPADPISPKFQIAISLDVWEWIIWTAVVLFVIGFASGYILRSRWTLSYLGAMLLTMLSSAWSVASTFVRKGWKPAGPRP
jgi:hypothetical protein